MKTQAVVCAPRGEALEEYLNALFGYYENEGIGKSIEVGALMLPRSLFETILSKYGLELNDATFEEIIQGDYYSVLHRYGFIEISNSLGGVE